MKTVYSRLFLASGALLLGLWSMGCYTQVGTVQDEPTYVSEGDEQEYVAEDTVSTEEYEQARGDFYDGTYDYYYPTVTIGLGYHNPWYWRYRSWYQYDPYWYDPFWGWCGTTYPYYYSGWGIPPIYVGYDPYYGHGHFGNSGTGYVTRGGDRYGTTRTFGSTRTSGPVRGGSGTQYTPTTGRAGTGGTPTTLPTGRVSSGRRATQQGKPGGTSVDRGASRSSSGRSAGVKKDATRTAPRPESGNRSSGSRERASSPTRSRGGDSGYSSPGNSGGSRPSSAPQGGGGNSGGSSGGNSSGGRGSAPSNSGDRGGGRR